MQYHIFIYKIHNIIRNQFENKIMLYISKVFVNLSRFFPIIYTLKGINNPILNK